MRKAIVFAVAAALLGYGVANAGYYAEDWNTDPGVGLGGWTGDNIEWAATGGMDDSGHLKAYRPRDNYPPYMGTSAEPVKSATGGNVNANFGPVFTIDLDAMYEDDAPPDEIGYGWWIYDTEGGLWYINLEASGTLVEDVWRHYSVEFDTTWTADRRPDRQPRQALDRELSRGRLGRRRPDGPDV